MEGKIFEGEGCYDFDIFVDELFDTARSIVDELERYAGKHVETELDQTKRKLLRLLHVFILPALKLRESELNDLQTTLSWIEHKHQSIEIMIGKRDKTKYNVENSLREQRARLLIHNDFGSQKYVATCDSEFLQIFLKHLQKDIASSNDKLLDYDREIGPLRDSVGSDDIRRLSDRRAERDQTLAYIDRAIEARETIKNVIGRPHVLKKVKVSKRLQNQPFHVLYVEIAQRLLEMNKEIQDLIKTKIQISSVREATLLAITELTEDGESYGYERKAGTFEFETDIYDPKNKPEEWATLSEKIADLLKAKPLGYRDSHEKFCERIKLKCQSLFDDSKLFSCSSSPREEETVNNLTVPVPISPSTAQVLDILGQSSVDRRSTRSGSSPFSVSHRDAIRSAARSRSYSTRFSFGNIPREATEAICKEIITHISEMAEDLAKDLYKKPLSQIYTSVLNKIYICYESRISTELMPVLQDMYEQSYRKQCEGLSRWISSISLSDIGFDERKFEILVCPSVAKEQKAEKDLGKNNTCEETEVKVPIGEERPRLSLEEISKMSVDELYKYSNMELAGRETLISCAPGMDGWLELSSESENKSTSETDGVCSNENGFENKRKAIDYSVLEMGVLDVHEHDTVFETGSSSIKPGVSPTDCMIKYAENFISSLNRSHRKSKRVPDRAVVIDEYSADHTDLRTSNTAHTEEDEEPPRYEEVVMRRKTTPPPEYSEVSVVKGAFYEAFEMFETILRKETEEVSLFKKLHVMTKAIQYVEKEIANLRDASKSNVLVCADDILDIVIILLSRLDADTFLKVYAHMNLMIHLSPRFMHGNAHDYALVTFNVAYQHMFEQHVLTKSPKQ